MCPKDFVSDRNISNLLKESPHCEINWNLNYELRVTNYEVKIPRAFARLYGII